MKKQNKKSKIDSFKETLALKKEDRKIPALGISSRLAIHEVRIEKHLSGIDSSFFEIGKELAEIQLENDFAEDTFEKYVKNRWNRNRDWGYKMISGYQIKAGLTESVLPVIQNQKQALALGKAPKEKRDAILKEIIKDGEAATPKNIEAKIKEKAGFVGTVKNAEPTIEKATFRDVVKDANGDEVPEEIASEFQKSRDEVKEIRAKLNEVRRWIENEELFKVEIARTAAIESVKDVLSMLAVGAGDYLCPLCKGKKCKVCSKRGFVSKLFYSQKISDDKK